jgi:hypothetical protein
LHLGQSDTVAALWFCDSVLERWNPEHILMVDNESEQIEAILFSSYSPRNLFYFSQATPELLLFYAKVGGLFTCKEWYGALSNTNRQFGGRLGTSISLTHPPPKFFEVNFVVVIPLFVFYLIIMHAPETPSPNQHVQLSTADQHCRSSLQVSIFHLPFLYRKTVQLCFLYHVIHCE